MMVLCKKRQGKKSVDHQGPCVRFISSFALWIGLAALMVVGTLSCSPNTNTPRTKTQVIQVRDAKVTVFGKAFMVERPLLPHYPKIVAVQGTPYERGYQQAYLLADVIMDNLSGFLTPIYSQYGGWVPDGKTAPTKQQWEIGRQVLLSKYNAYFDAVLKEKGADLLEEMKGMAAGLKDAGRDVEWSDVLIGNFIPEVTTSSLFVSASAAAVMGGPAECSHAMAWGAATHDGRLLHGMNYDYNTFNVLHRNLIILVVKPDKGQAFIGARTAGTVGQHRGMNEAGLTVGESTSQSADNNLRTNPRLTDHMTLRMILQYATNIQQAIDLSYQYGPGTTGYNHSIGDSVARTGRVLETSCNHLAEVTPSGGLDALWATNHSVAYPGYQGYAGYNMVTDQVKAWGWSWSDVDTVDKWMAKLKTSKINMNSWGRSETIGSMISASYGQIDVAKMIEIMSADPVSQTPPAPIQYAPTCMQMYGFNRPIVDQQLLSIMSAVFDPADKTIWAAVGDTPAQRGTFWPIDFSRLLQVMGSFRFEDLIVDTDNDGIPDDWERAFRLNPNSASDAGADPDGDGKNNLEEYRKGTHPLMKD